MTDIGESQIGEVPESALIEFLGLPSQVLVGQKISKKALIEMGVSGRVGKKLVQELIGELLWTASIKSSNTGLPGSKDAESSTYEIEVLVGRLRSETSRPSMIKDLTTQIHRSIPYPMLLVMVGKNGWIELSMSTPPVISANAPQGLPINQIFTVRLADEMLEQIQNQTFPNFFQLGMLPRFSVSEFYISWFDRLLAYAISLRTGVLSPSKSIAETVLRLEALLLSISFESQISALKIKAEKTKQIKVRSDINIQLRDLTIKFNEYQRLLFATNSARMD